MLERCGGTLVTPQDDRWPSSLDDLGPAAPFALWVRGETDVRRATARSVAIVGARASTDYGDRTAAELAAGLATRGFTIVSGAAYGIDAAAHRGTLAAGGPTLAVLACGVDRVYPQGNDGLLRAIVADSGTVLSEVPPGSAPYRQRFLARNRIIAALSGATVIVEAGRRSGALATARRAIDLMRPVGAVPGSVHSMTSVGCHDLLRDQAAVCVTDVDQVIELAGPLGEAPRGDADARQAVAADTAVAAVPDATTPDERVLLDALPVRAAATPDALARAAGLPAVRVLGLLTALERQDLAVRDGARWRRARA